MEILKHNINAPHGAPDGGAVGISGIEEKDINLSIALKLCEVLEGKGIDVVMTRTGDNGLWESNSQTIREKKVSDMHNRLDIIKKSNADLFISIHMNAFTDSSASGLNVFYSKKYPECEEISKFIEKNIAKTAGTKTNSVKTADSRLYLMKNSPIPAILVECGFISNSEEEKRLTDEKYQAEIAWAIAESLEKSKDILTN